VTDAPITVPAPALLPRPIVAVERGGEIVWIDPSADNTAVPALPADLYGGTGWFARDLPMSRTGASVVDGEVRLVTEAKVTRSGSLAWRTDMNASGAALEHIRDLLVPLSVEGRSQALQNLLSVARPKIARLDIDIDGVERPSDELRITISGTDTDRFQAIAGGLQGTIPPVLAATLARWLPPNIRIEERVTVSGPPDLEVLATTELRSEFRAEAQVSRIQVPDRRRTVFVTEVLRPYRSTSPAVENQATRFLDDEAARSPQIWLYPRMTATVAKLARTSPDPSRSRAPSCRPCSTSRPTTARRPHAPSERPQRHCH
jgi:hypothetical protein